MTFDCKRCQRSLPDWMNAGQKTCTTCSKEEDTETKLESIRDQERFTGEKPIRTSTNTTQRQPSSGYRKTSEPEVVDTSAYAVSSGPSTKQTETETDSGSSSSKETTAYSASRAELSKDPSTQLYYQPSIPEEFQISQRVHVFSLGYYNADDYQKDGYSSRLIKFSKENQLSELSFFATQLNAFFDQRLRGGIEPDWITVYPGHAGEISDALQHLTKETTDERQFRYRELLSRTESRVMQHKQEYEDRWENQQGSIGVTRDVEGKTVFILDDICTSGASLTEEIVALRKAGADRVIGLCLGLSTKQPGQYIKRISDQRHTIWSTISDE